MFDLSNCVKVCMEFRQGAYLRSRHGAADNYEYPERVNMVEQHGGLTPACWVETLHEVWGGECNKWNTNG